MQDTWLLLSFFLDNRTFLNLSRPDPCAYEKHDWLEAKLILISICGTTIAVLGILGNVITAIVLTRPGMRTPNNLYLTFLAIFDILLLFSAIALYSVEYLFEYLDSLALYHAWVKFVRYVFATSHVAQTGSVYLTVAVTFERYFAVLHPRRAKILCTHDRATLSITMVVGFSILFNCTKYFEVEVIHNDNCTGFSAQRLTASSLLANHIYQTIHSLWLTQMVMVFIPFIVLSFVNTAIVYKVRKTLKRLSWIQRGNKRRQLKEKTKDATKVSIVLVGVFLVCNSWGFVTTLLENMHTDHKLRAWWPVFYEFSREVINFLAIVNSSINFVIYCIFGKDFRQELINIWRCKGLFLIFPIRDKYTAENLLDSWQHRRHSMLGRYLNLIRVAQNLDEKEGKKTSDESALQGTPTGANTLSVIHSHHHSHGGSDKDRGTLTRKATISSGDYNRDFVSVGIEESTFAIIPHADPFQRFHHQNGNIFNLSDASSAPSPAWKNLLLAQGWVCGLGVIPARASAGHCDGRAPTTDTEISTDVSPLATLPNDEGKLENDTMALEYEEDVWV